VELEEGGLLDFVKAGEVVCLAACAPFPLPRVGPLSGAAVGVDGNVEACAAGCSVV
jgi:hypothetical protein